jgi:anti-sigma B factor antagonist
MYCHVAPAIVIAAAESINARRCLMSLVPDVPGDVAVVDVEGSLLGRSATLRTRVDRLLQRGERKIVVNLAGVTDIDAAGVGQLVAAYNRTIATNGVFRIARASGAIRELLARVGLFNLLSEEDGTERVADSRAPSPSRPAARSPT